MRNWFYNYFSNQAKISRFRRYLSIILGILLFSAMVIFGVLLVLQLSVFNPDYIASYVDDINVSSLASDWLNENVAPDNPITAKAAELGIDYYEPQIKEQMRSVIRNVYAFFLTKLEEGRLLETIAEQRPLINDVANNVQVILDVPALKSILDNLGINPDSIKNVINIDQINGYLDLAAKVAQIQTLIVFAKNFYYPMIAIIAAIIIAIIFTARKVRLIALTLGLSFSVYGIVQLVSLLPIRNYGKSAIPNLGLNLAVSNSLLRFINDISQILLIFSSVVLFCGVALLAGYFIINARKAAALKRYETSK